MPALPRAALTQPVLPTPGLSLSPHAHSYVTVYADGPTRVLRFSDDRNVSSLEAQDVILDLAARLKQVQGEGVGWLVLRGGVRLAGAGWALT